jgi:hypothetical protein
LPQSACLFFPGRQDNGLAGDHEIPAATVMQRPRLLDGGIDPGLHDLQNKEIIFGNMSGIFYCY